MWSPTQLRGGPVIRGGLNPREEGEAAEKKVWGKHRAVVLNTYPPIETKTITGTPDIYNDSNVSGSRVECDVLLIRRMIFVPKAIVLQGEHGYNNSTTWVPKESSRSLNLTNPILNLQARSPMGIPSFIPVTAMDDLDGDNVLVEFIEGDQDFPAVVAPWTHRKAKRIVAKGAGWEEDENPLQPSHGTPFANEKYLHHNGTEIRINESGGVLIDTSGAWIDAVTGLGDADTEAVPPNLPAPSPQGGPVRLRLKPLAKFTIESGGKDIFEVYTDVLGQVHIDLGEGAAQRIVRGERLVAWLAAHTHPTGVGPTGPPTTVLGQQAFGGEILNTITNLATFLSALHKVENASLGELPLP